MYGAPFAYGQDAHPRKAPTAKGRILDAFDGNEIQGRRHAQAAGYFVIVGFVSYLVAGHAAVYPAQRIVTPKRRGLKGDAALTVEGALERHRRELEELMDE